MSPHRRVLGRILPAAVLVATALPVAAAPGCDVRLRNRTTALLLCTPGLDKAALQAATQQACEGRSGCAAWVWEDARHLPAQAPAEGQQPDKAATAQARALWLHDTQQLLLMRQVK